MSRDALSPRQFMYHHSPAENRESIKKYGLHPSDPYDPSYHEDRDQAPVGVYLSPHDLSPASYGHDVWRVKTKGSYSLRDDPDDPNGEYGFKYSPNHISPDRVKLAKKGISR